MTIKPLSTQMHMILLHGNFQEKIDQNKLTFFNRPPGPSSRLHTLKGQNVPSRLRQRNYGFSVGVAKYANRLPAPIILFILFIE